MSITAKEIAKMLNLSPSAVSIALNGKPGIGENTRKLILDKAKELNYSFQGHKNNNATTQTLRYVIYVGDGLIVNESSFHSIVLA